MRTGAVAGVASIFLAKKDSKTAAIIGAGVQARTQLMALHAVLPDLNVAKVYDVRADSAERYAKEMGKRLSMHVSATESAQDAVEDSDIIVTATVADEPIVKNSWVREGSLFIHIGSYQEEEYEVVQSSDKIVVDDWDQVKHRGTQILCKMLRVGLLKEDGIHANLGEIVIGRKKGRENDKEKIFFCPIGMSIEDIAASTKIYKNALEKNLGQRLILWISPEFE